MKLDTLKILKRHGIRVPDFIEVDTLDETQNLSNNKRYAVRSNCVVEDSKDKSHAGEFKTLLNVCKQDLEEAIQSVKLSYRGQKGNVIIQEMIESDISGVVFTINPIGILNELVIVYGTGLGCNVVEDKVKSNTIYYNKNDDKYYTSIQDASIDLENKLVKKLVRLALKIESILGYYCDIEYAIKDTKIYILQARPITGIEVNKKITLDNSNIVESYPGVSLPLTQSFAKEIYRDIFSSLVLRISADEQLMQGMQTIFDGMVDSYNGYMYYRINNWYSVLGLLPLSDKIIKIWQSSLGVEDKTVCTDDNIYLSKITKLGILIRFIGYLGNKTPKEMYQLNKYFKSRIKTYYKQVKEAESIQELVGIYDNIEQSLVKKWDITLINDMYAFIYSYLSNKDRISSIKGMASKKPIFALNKLIAIKNKYGIDSIAYEKAKSRFICLYGDRCIGELKLETKTYRTNPELVDDLVKSGSIVKIDSNISCRHNIIESRTITGIKNREESRLNRSRIFGITRMIMLKIGKLMYEQGLIEDTQDIFYLRLEEIRNIQPYKELIAQRKVEYDYYKKIPTNRRLVFANRVVNKPIENVLIHKNKSSNNILYGVATSYGKIIGEVVKVDTPDTEIDVSDKIIVAESTDPGWVYLIEKCKGIIVEKGSLLSHTAIISRELKKPAIVNVEDAMTILNNGDIVEIDTYHGVIKINKGR